MRYGSQFQEPVRGWFPTVRSDTTSSSRLSLNLLGTRPASWRSEQQLVAAARFEGEGDDDDQGYADDRRVRDAVVGDGSALTDTRDTDYYARAVR